MRKLLYTCLLQVVTALAVMVPGHAQDLIPVEKFAKLPAAQDLKLSPDGNYYAGLLRIEGQNLFIIVPTDGSTDNMQMIRYGEFTPGSWQWAGNKYIVIEISVASRRYGIKSVEKRLSTINIETGETYPTVKIKERASAKSKKNHISQFQSTVVSYLPDDDEQILMELDTDSPNKPDVVRVKLSSGKYTRHTRYRGGTTTWKADSKGHVRMGYGYAIKSNGEYSDNFDVLFRASIEDEWKHLKAPEDPDNPYSPISFTEDPHIILVSARNKHGCLSLYTWDTRTEEVDKVLFWDEKFDYSYSTKLPGTDRVAAVYYYADELEAIFIDDEEKQNQEVLEKVFPGQKVRIISRSDAYDKFILRVGSPNVPATYYFLNTKTGNATEITHNYPQLMNLELPRPKPITYVTRDGVEIPGYLTITKGSEGKNLPMIAHPHGGPHRRDTLRFYPWVQYFAGGGWAVLQMNFRGSSGYGQKFREAGRGQWGCLMQDDVTDGVHWAIQEGIADPGRICIVGGSYGAYVALQATFKTPDLFKYAVGLNGLYDILADIQRHRNYIGHARYRAAMTQEDPKEISPTHNVEHIKVPVLIAYGEDDRNVDEKQSKKLISKLKRAKREYVALELKDARHSFSQEGDQITFFQEMDKFLQQHLGLGPMPAGEAAGGE